MDLVSPTFSDPTTITNPLFPISELQSVVLVGRLHGRPWRAETTLLPDTKMVDWNGQRVEARQSQFIAYLDGRIFEVAVDLYAQADDGSVWYFGEDAFTYRKGRPADTEGTWLAGVDGPPAMIMPGHPQVGDVYRTENIPGVVFEQVTVAKIDQTLAGPTGPVSGAMIAHELHMDEARIEDKTFAPGYGEFHSGQGNTFEATALAVPADALSGGTPAELATLSTGSLDVVDAASAGDWSAASAVIDRMDAAWTALPAGDAPSMLGVQMRDALRRLTLAVGARDERESTLKAFDVARSVLDLELRYRSSVDVNIARFGLWTRQLQADAAAGDLAGVVGDVTTLEWIRDRIALDGADAGLIDDQLRSLEAAAASGEFRGASDAATRLRVTMDGLHPRG